MPTSEFSTSKTVFILAIIAGCFAILWPKVFYPMMQAAFTITKPRLTGSGEQQVCCDVISEGQVEVQLFAAVCQAVIARELATEGGIRKFRNEKYPPPGMLERCRRRIFQLCDGLDVSDALLRTADAGAIARTATTPAANSQPPGALPGEPLPPASAEDRQLLANLSDCLRRLESERLEAEARVRRIRRPAREPTLPSHVRQERPPHHGPPVTHPALQERGNPFPGHHLPPAQVVAMTASKSGPPGGVRPPAGAGPGKTLAKGSGAMGFLMPIYTVGIVVFFAYTITKVWFRKPEDHTPKIMDFHMDPEYRKYVLSEEYGGRGQPISYAEFVRQREAEERKRAAAKLLSDTGRKQVFTAIEGIIAEMDHFRDKLMADQKSVDIEEEPLSEDESMCVTQSEMDSESAFAPVAPLPQDDEEVDDAPLEGFECETPEPGDLEEEEADLVLEVNGVNGFVEEVDEEVVERPVETTPPPPAMDLASQLARLAVMGIDTRADFQERVLAPEDDPDDPEVAAEIANILLQTSVPEDAQLLMSESQYLTHTPTEPLDGWWSTGGEDGCEAPVVVTGKMTISLLARGESPSGHRPGSAHATVVDATATCRTPEVTTERQMRQPAPVRQPRADDEERQRAIAERQRLQIEELANSLVQDILRNQVPKVLERQSAGQSVGAVAPCEEFTPDDTDTFELVTAASSNGQVSTARTPAGPPRRGASRESLNSQGSSFEYLSACQDTQPGNLSNGHHHHHHQELSPSPLSPDAEAFYAEMAAATTLDAHQQNSPFPPAAAGDPNESEDL